MAAEIELRRIATDADADTGTLRVCGCGHNRTQQDCEYYCSDRFHESPPEDDTREQEPRHGCVIASPWTSIYICQWAISCTHCWQGVAPSRLLRPQFRLRGPATFCHAPNSSITAESTTPRST